MAGFILIPWLIFLFLWSIPRLLQNLHLEKEVELELLEPSEFLENLLGWDFGRHSFTAIGFYYAVVTGWCINYFQTIRGGLGSEVDTTEVWNNFLQSRTSNFFPGYCCFDNYGRYLGCAKAIEKANVTLMVSLFILLFTALFLAFVMDLRDGSLDGFVYIFGIQPEYLLEPET